MTSQRLGEESRFGRNLLSAALAFATVAVLIVHGLANVKQAHAQSQASAQTSADATLPAFEVASIKADHSGSNMIRIGGPEVSRFRSTNASAKRLIDFAYNMQDFQVLGGPSWITADKFDIDAKVEDSVVEQLQKLTHEQQIDQTRLMVQSLLKDRFNLSVSHSTKELPVYALVVAKGGPKLKQAAPPDAQGSSALAPPPHPDAPTPPPGSVTMRIGRGGEATLTASASPIANLVYWLSLQLGRQTIDQTWLKGIYDITLSWTSETGLLGAPLQPAPVAPDSAGANDTGGTSIFTAIQEQLGLRLKSTKGPVDIIVIEHIEEPSEN